jgi:hypothetical protein
MARTMVAPFSLPGHGFEFRSTIQSTKCAVFYDFARMVAEEIDVLRLAILQHAKDLLSESTHDVAIAIRTTTSTYTMRLVTRMVVFGAGDPDCADKRVGARRLAARQTTAERIMRQSPERARQDIT